MLSLNAEKQLVAAAVDQFPSTFGLRAFPGDTFRVSSSSSYVNDSGVVQLYTQIQRDGKWLDFAKGEINELKREYVVLEGGR
jgi:hypothetical protein